MKPMEKQSWSKGRALPIVVALALFLAACGGNAGDDELPAAATAEDSIVAQVASYELVADRDQRFIVGLFSNDAGMVSFGTAELSFSYLGPEGEPLDEPTPGPEVSATFLPIPGVAAAEGDDGLARFTSPSEARGVYGTESVRFDDPGFWEVAVEIEIDGEPQRATAAFEVGDEAHVPLPGEPAPRTENVLPGAADAPPDAVDSRADDDGTVPDPELHRETVASAIDSGRPVMVVVSTPVYCVSRFCGPITDTVQQLAVEHGDAMAFVHIEVWKDFEEETLNKAAAEWIWPDRAGDPAEPWVFLVDGDGMIVERWDNVATEASLRDSVAEVLEVTG